MARKLHVLGFLSYGIFCALLFIGCAKQKLDPAGIYLAIGGQVYVEIGRDASGNLVVKGTSLFQALPPRPESERKNRVYLEGQKLVLVSELRWELAVPPALIPARQGAPESAQVNRYVSRIYYEFVPSTARPGDWDLVADHEWNGLQEEMPPVKKIPKREQHIASFLHRVNDRRVVEYFGLLADYDYHAIYGPPPAPRPQPDVEHLMELSSGLLESYPDDLYVRTLYLDALIRKKDHETLASRLTAWREAYAATDDPLLSKIFRRAQNTLEALELSAAGRNAYDFVAKVLSPETDLTTRLAWFPEILGWEQYIRPESSLILTPIVNFLELQISAKVFRVEAVFMMLQGKREEALKLLAATYHLGKLSNQSDTVIDRLIGGALRAIATRGLEIYALNCCETPDDFEYLWEICEELCAKGQERELVESSTLVPEEVVEQYNARERVVDANFMLVRMAVAAKRRFVAEQEFPRSADEFAPLLPAGPPQDPFTTAPLRFFSQPNVFKCYSIGPDEQDDRASVSYDPTNGTVSRGDIMVEIPREREYPFPRDGVKAASADQLRKQFPNGLPNDPFTYPPRGLGVTNTTPVYVYSVGPDRFEKEALGDEEGYVATDLYDPTNGTVSRGDLFIAIPP